MKRINVSCVEFLRIMEKGASPRVATDPANGGTTKLYIYDGESNMVRITLTYNQVSRLIVDLLDNS